jgi:hypothetical protein
MKTHRRTKRRTKTKRRIQKGGFELSTIVDPIKNTSISAANATENGLTKVTDFFGNTWSSTKKAWSNLFSTNTNSTSYIGGKRRRRRKH